MSDQPEVTRKLLKPFGLTLAFLGLLVMLSIAIVLLDDYDWLLLLLIVPILFSAMEHPRRVYLPLLAALLLAALIVTRFISPNWWGSVQTIAASAVAVAVTAEVIHHQAERWRQVQARLKDSETKYATVFHTSPEMMLITRIADGKIIEVNEAFVRDSGYSVEEAVGKSVFELNFWQEPADRERMVEQVQKTGVAHFEAALRARNGSIATVLFSAGLFEWHGEKYLFNSLTDITPRKAMEEALRQEKERSKAMLNANPDTLFRLSRDGVYLDFYSHERGRTGKAMNFIGKHLQDVLPPDVAELSLRAVQETLRSGELQRIEYHLDRNGKSRDFEARLAVSGPDEVLAVVRDITARKLSELRLMEAEERYRNLVEQVESIIYLNQRDDDNTNLYISPQVEKMTGYSMEEWRNTPRLWLNSIHPDDRGQVEAEHLRTNQTGEPFHMEYRLVTQCGRVIWVEDHAVLVPGPDGELTQWQGVCFDVTARKRSELVQGATFRIAQAALDAHDLDDFYPAVHAILSELIPANNMFIALYEPPTDQLTFPFWADERDPCPQPNQPKHGLTEYVLRSGKSQLVGPERFNQLAVEGEINLTDVGSVSVDWLGTPLVINERVTGVLVVQSYNPNLRLGVDEQNILEFISGQIAMTIDRVQSVAALRESEERYSLAVRGANDGIWDWNLRTNEVYYSPRWKEILGVSGDHLASSPDAWFSRIHPQDLERVMSEVSQHLRGESEHFESEHRLLHVDGGYRWVQNRGLAVRSAGQALRIAGSMSDITLRKQAEEKLRHDTMHDTLTNLPNRAYFINLLSLALERIHRRPDYQAAVLFLDLDRFKIVNESLGHHIGDQLLKAVGERIQGCLRPGDTLARLSGDEFAILLEEIENFGAASHTASLIQQRLAQPFNFQGHEVFTSVTVGVVFVEPGYERPDELMRDADAATYRAKAVGRGRIEIFNTDMHRASMAALQMETDLRRAIDREEFRLYFQPIVSLRDRKVRSFEALLRWQHPTRGIVMPGDFINLADDTGLILPIGEWVLRSACRQVKTWQKAGFEDVKVAVNISARQIQDQDLIQVLQDVQAQEGVDGRNLQLEVTEYATMRDLERSERILKDIRAMGIEILIDDFGTGYSSMSYLKRFPVSYLKIAQTFIRDVTLDPEDAAITTAIIALAHAMEMRVVAEGVETQAQFNFLIEQGCDEIQGYYINPAMPAISTTRFLQGGLEDRMGSM